MEAMAYLHFDELIGVRIWDGPDEARVLPGPHHHLVVGATGVAVQRCIIKDVVDITSHIKVVGRKLCNTKQILCNTLYTTSQNGDAK